MQIVLNKSYGGYGLSAKAYEFLGLEVTEDVIHFGGSAFEDDRTNPKLIACIEALGDEASGRFSLLRIEEFNLPEIKNYDGLEYLEY